MRPIRSQRRRVGDVTIYVTECPTLWIVSTTMRNNTTVTRRCNVRHKKREFRTINDVERHILCTERGTFEYVNDLGNIMRVDCTYKEYLFLKMNYGRDGLTEQEYELYKSL